MLRQLEFIRVLFRSDRKSQRLISSQAEDGIRDSEVTGVQTRALPIHRKSTRLNSSHLRISYAVFCLTKDQTCALDRKSTRLNSSHLRISQAVFCLKKDVACQQEVERVRASLGGATVGLLAHRAELVEVEHLAVASHAAFFVKDRAPTDIAPLPLHDPLPI